MISIYGDFDAIRHALLAHHVSRHGILDQIAAQALQALIICVGWRIHVARQAFHSLGDTWIILCQVSTPHDTRSEQLLHLSVQQSRL